MDTHELIGWLQNQSGVTVVIGVEQNVIIRKTDVQLSETATGYTFEIEGTGFVDTLARFHKGMQVIES